MGSPKALLRWQGETFVDRLVSVLSTSCSPVIVVAGEHFEAIRSGAARPSDFQLVRNPDPDRGMLSSLQCGLAVLPGDLDAFLFTPVDMPRIEPETISALLTALESAPVAVPRYNGRRGHPVAARAALIADFLALDPTASPRDVLRRFDSQTAFRDVQGDGVLTDIDTPADYESLLAATRL
jgi:molybdenum cofactor cytidylyltransferase